MKAPQTINGVPVEVITGAIERIEREDGVCHPSRLVAAAKSKRSPLHPLFEWDDSAAAGAWRTHQARRVINTIRVQIDGVDEPVPAFVHVTRVTDDGVAEGYMGTLRALSGDTKAGVINDALRLLRGVRRRYGQLSELDSVWSAIDSLEREDVAA